MGRENKAVKFYGCRQAACRTAEIGGKIRAVETCK